ncbi:MAG: methylenetetrahydrofolate reductase [NAD(P)H] [Armatimonadetes bacterium]|nr:methylenetetrahydrofolate reductase [NAD(P)H] [Armatimonadota bacterium]
MSFLDKLHNGTPTLSFEFFPPKNPDGWSTLYQTLGNIARRNPDYVTVTYGAGGSTRRKTVDLVSRIQDELGIEAMAHLTCVGHSRDELTEILSSLQAAGIKYIMALRGDPPKGQTKFVAHECGFAYASDLIAFIKDHFDFHLGCSFYPETHPEAESPERDIEVLRLKQDSGADFAVSQIFFDNDTFYRFRDKAARMGVTLPLVAGILPVTSLAQLAPDGICQRSGTGVPQSLLDFLGTGDDIVDRGVQYAHRQCRDLLEHGVPGIHFYTLNRSPSSLRVTEALRADGYFPVPKLAAASR